MEKDIFVDLTSLVSATKDNPSLIYYAEKIILENPNFKIITHINQVNDALEIFRLIFDEAQPIYELISIGNHEEEILVDKTVKIIDLTKDEVEKAIKEISNNFFGHKKFKDQLPSAISNFILLNVLRRRRYFPFFFWENLNLLPC